MRRAYLLLIPLSLGSCSQDHPTATLLVHDIRSEVLIPPATNGAGVYYMSGWTTDPDLEPLRYPWEPLKAWNVTHPNCAPQDFCRQPHWLTAFGGPDVYYDNSRQEVVDNNILGIYDAKFQFVTFQTGWTRTQGAPDLSLSKPFWTHAIARYKTSPYKNLLQWALLYDEEDNSSDHNANVRWGNRTNDSLHVPWTSPDYRADFAKMVAYWRDNFLLDPQYLRIDGKPVIYILANLSRPHDLGYFPGSEATPAALIQLLRQTVATAGVQVYLVGFAYNLAEVAARKNEGFDAITGYQYRGPDTTYGTGNWSNKAQLYRTTWANMASWATSYGLSYFPPTTTGFDNRDLPDDPANGFHGVYEATSTVPQYEAHVQEAKNFIVGKSALTRGIVMNCCWNEWTEGATLDRQYDLSIYKGTDHADGHMRVYAGRSPGSNRLPIGNLDGIVDGHFTLSGWALDQDDPSQGVTLDVYLDGTYIGGGGTIYYHSYVNSAYGVVGNHGFRIPAPTGFRDGRSHHAQVYAFDTSGPFASLVGDGYVVVNP